MKREFNNNVKAALRDITKLINDYREFPLQGVINLGRIHEIIQDLEVDDYAVLREGLTELGEDKSISDVCFNSAGEMMSAAHMDQCFGGVSPSMGDWYDNEIAVASSDHSPPQRVIDRIFELIALVEKQVRVCPRMT